MQTEDHGRFGKLASDAGYRMQPLQVLHSKAGYYIGTSNSELGPISRESVEYFPDSNAAHSALDSGSWTQRLTP